MKAHFLISILALGVLSTAAFASPEAQPFSFRVEVPSTEGGCIGNAFDIATKFSRATEHTSEVTGQCAGSRTIKEKGIQYSLDTVIVHYTAAAEMVPVRAIFSADQFMGSPSTSQGLFSTYAACLSELGRQEPGFEGQTGLIAVDARCELENTIVGRPAYALIIEGYGKAQKYLFAYTQYSPIVNPQRSNELLKSAELAITASGGQIAFEDSSRVFYYSPYAISVFSEDFATFSDASQCTDQVSELRAILSGQRMDGVSVFCASEFANDSKEISLTAVGAGIDMGTHLTASDRYSSYDECKGDKARVIQNATSSGETVLGAICRPDGESSFVVDLYFNYE